MFTIMITGITICQRLDAVLEEMKKPKKVEVQLKIKQKQIPRKIVPKKPWTPV
jgi:hypothetical protein